MPKKPEARNQLRAPEAKIIARARTPMRPCGAARHAASVAQPDAACLDAARRARPPQMPKKLNAEEAKTAEGQWSRNKIVFRDGAAGDFEPAPLNRRCLPETTSPPREAGASESAVTTYEVTIPTQTVCYVGPTTCTM